MRRTPSTRSTLATTPVAALRAPPDVLALTIECVAAVGFEGTVTLLPSAVLAAPTCVVNVDPVVAKLPAAVWALAVRAVAMVAVNTTTVWRRVLSAELTAQFV